MPKLFALNRTRARYLSLTALAFALVTGAAFAAPAAKTSETKAGASSDPTRCPHGPGAKRGGRHLDPFARWDRDKDDKLVLKDLPERAKNHLTIADVNRDGLLTRAEFEAGKEQLRAERMKELDTDKDGKVSPEERKAGMRAHLAERFAADDKNKDGALTADELPRPMFERFAAADANKDNRLTRAEIEGAIANGTLGPRGHGHAGRPQLSEAEREARMQAHFKSDDVNHDGFLTQTEIPTRWEHMVAADANRDGKLTIDELKKAIAAGTLGSPHQAGRRHHGQEGQNRPGHGSAR
jgi:Ca2+-binding EF-hand superfamily protein